MSAAPTRVGLTQALGAIGSVMSTDAIKPLLKLSPQGVRDYVKHLEKENSRLHAMIVKLECKNTSSSHRAESLQKELDKCIKKGHVTVVIRKLSDGGT
jgi:hypothetical protein